MDRNVLSLSSCLRFRSVCGIDFAVAEVTYSDTFRKRLEFAFGMHISQNFKFFNNHNKNIYSQQLLYLLGALKERNGIINQQTPGKGYVFGRSC